MESRNQRIKRGKRRKIDKEIFDKNLFFNYCRIKGQNAQT